MKMLAKRYRFSIPEGIPCLSLIEAMWRGCSLQETKGMKKFNEEHFESGNKSRRHERHDQFDN